VEQVAGNLDRRWGLRGRELLDQCGHLDGAVRRKILRIAT
jgi:hypothetical protein